MSRILFHSKERTVEVSGAERAYARVMSTDLLCTILGVQLLNPSQKDTIFHKILPPSSYVWSLDSRCMDATIRSYLGGIGQNDLLWEGEEIDSWQVALNTMYRMGSNPLRLLARLHGQCEIHCYVTGENRRWLSDIIQEGLDSNILRKELRGYPIGWEEVIILLREYHQSPVVCSYSVCESFPNQEIARWEDEETWDNLEPPSRWLLGLQGLRDSDMTKERGLELSPTNWDTFYFGNGISAFDMMAEYTKGIEKNESE